MPAPTCILTGLSVEFVTTISNLFPLCGVLHPHASTIAHNSHFMGYLSSRASHFRFGFRKSSVYPSATKSVPHTTMATVSA